MSPSGAITGYAGTVEERFWAKVRKSKHCWKWSASTSSAGYGQIRIDGRLRAAHRVSWELANGPIQDGLLVLHHCDNPPCVNPAHLFVGTQSDNIQDASDKGRLKPDEVLRGEAHPSAKLTAESVRRIRASVNTGRELAAEYGVSVPLISNIKTRRAWRHVR